MRPKTLEPGTPDKSHTTRKNLPQAWDKAFEISPSTAGASTSSRGKSRAARKTLNPKPDHVVRKGSTSLSLQVHHADGGIKCEATEVNLSSQSNTRCLVGQTSHVAQASHVGSSKAIAAASRTSKGKNAEISLPSPRCPSSPAQATAQARTFAVQKSGGVSVQSSKGKLVASRTLRFAVSYAMDKKGNAENAAASQLIHGKSFQSYCKQTIVGHIRAEEGSHFDNLVEPLGTRCQLCKLDLAFTPKTSESSHSSELPPAAVLPCGHCYHKRCFDEVFGSVEPSCLSCFNNLISGPF